MAKPSRSRSAVLELTLLTVLIMAAVLVSFTWLSLRWQRSWQMEEARRGLTLASNILRGSLRDGMMQNRREQISDTIGRIARATQITRIRIVDHEGQIALSTLRSELSQMLEMDAPVCSVCHLGEGGAASPENLVTATRTVVEGSTMRAFTPVLAEPGCVTGACHAGEASTNVLGVIDLSLSLEDVEEALVLNQRTLGAVSLASTLLGGGLLWLALSKRFRRPIGDVLRGVRRVSRGDLSHRIPTRVSDEFGELAQSFNAMSHRLEMAQQNLIQSERLISMGKLAAGVAHEINNPLTGILSYAEDMMEDTDASDPRRKDCEVIVHEALRCRQIVRSLLDFARQDAPSPVGVRPRELIERSLDVVARQAAFLNLRFVQNIEENLPTIEVDPVQIQQVLVNLIVNAQQAMPEGGDIVLGARRADGGKRVEFSVKDQGTGVSPEVRSRIFEPFFSTKEGVTGGLGLSVCLGIVQQHDGTIDLENAPEKGTIFRVVLPVAARGDS